MNSFEVDRIAVILTVAWAALAVLSCGNRPPVREMPLPTLHEPHAEQAASVPRSSGGVAEEIRGLIETGTPQSLRLALERIRERGLGASEFGRMMNAVAVTLLQKLYPDIPVSGRLPAIDPPQTHNYTHILKEAERGVYAAPPASSQDYLEYALPCLAILQDAKSDRLALPDLRRAQKLRGNSVLAPYFIGLILERSAGTGTADTTSAGVADAGTKSADTTSAGTRSALEKALEAYDQAYIISEECYPAALGLARVMESLGRLREAIDFLTDLNIRYPNMRSLKRQLALARYQNQDWAGAEGLLAELLQQQSRDGQLLLMRAHALVEMDQFITAQGPLDLYGAQDPQNRQYLFLQARIQAEGYRNPDTAMSYLRTILQRFPQDEDALIYAARLLLETGETEDQAEGQEILTRLLAAENPAPAAVKLALKDAIRREAWEEARPYLRRILAERRGHEELLNLYTVERGLGNYRQALAAARELYQQDPSNMEGAEAYITALIDGGRPDEAGRMIENGLQTLPSGPLKSRYHYLRSRLRANDDQRIGDLRSSLFEDPRNLHTLIALFEIYRSHKNEQRAVFYLKQALALAPNNPRLKRYEAEYAGLLEN